MSPLWERRDAGRDALRVLLAEARPAARLIAGPIPHLPAAQCAGHPVPLLRDVIKVGVFYDQVFFGAIDRMANVESLKSAGAGGPALHLLLADEFQIDAYLAFGWKTDGAADYAPSLVLRQVF